MGLIKPFATIDNTEYYSIGIVAKFIGRTTQTLRLWDDYSEELEATGRDRIIPTPTRIGKNNTRCWNEEEVLSIAKFAKNIGYGDIAEFSRTRRSDGGRNISEDRSTQSRKERDETRKQIDKKAKKVQSRERIKQLKAAKGNMLKAARKRANRMYEGMDLNEAGKN